MPAPHISQEHKASHSRVLALVVAGVGLAGLSRPTEVHAYEDVVSVDLGAGYRWFALDGHAPTLALGIAYGPTDEWELRGELGYAQVFRDNKNAAVPSARLELGYVLDILSVVPTFGLGIGADYETQAGALTLEAHLSVGLDYLVSRSLAIGCVLRQSLLVQDLAEAASLGASTEVAFRVRWLFALAP